MLKDTQKRHKTCTPTQDLGLTDRTEEAGKISRFTKVTECKAQTMARFCFDAEPSLSESAPGPHLQRPLLTPSPFVTHSDSEAVSLGSLSCKIKKPTSAS